jgi:hypothetical protein
LSIPERGRPSVPILRSWDDPFQTWLPVGRNPSASTLKVAFQRRPTPRAMTARRATGATGRATQPSRRNVAFGSDSDVPRLFGMSGYVRIAAFELRSRVCQELTCHSHVTDFGALSVHPQTQRPMALPRQAQETTALGELIGDLWGYQFGKKLAPEARLHLQALSGPGPCSFQTSA